MMASKQRVTQALALPRPETVTLTEVRDRLLPAAVDLRQQIARRGDLPAAREMCRQLEAFRKYLQDREGRDLLAAECRRTEVLIGKLLGPGELGTNQHSEPLPTGNSSDFPRIDRHKFRLLAAHEELVEELLADGKVSRNVILEKIQRRQRVEESPEAGPEIRTGDCRAELADVPDESVALLLTDPPYAEEALDLYSDLGTVAARLLMPGGSLVCYTGQAILPAVLDRLQEHLRYWWTFALTHEHGGQQLPGKWVLVEWKPLVWFVKDYRLGREYLADRLRGSRPEKAHHEWAQGIEEVAYLIERLTEPGETVCDPFAGSGAFGRAALSLGRRFLGVDVDPRHGMG
jgi:16S rRNA G966 N2-methylase RsmD